MVTDDLFKKLNEIVKSYPDGIKPVPGDRIVGTAFFPGGDGLYKHENISETSVMILGQDFDNEENFKCSRHYKSEVGKPKRNATWHNLKKIFEEENSVPLKNFFFTNAIMGLRAVDTKNTGRSKAFNDEKRSIDFLKECRDFFKVQVKIQNPKLIIGLGAHIPKFLSGVSDELVELSKIASLKDIGATIKENIKHFAINGLEIKVIFITHPCMYQRNVVTRHSRGKDFEYDLIQTALMGISLNHKS